MTIPKKEGRFRKEPPFFWFSSQVAMNRRARIWAERAILLPDHLNKMIAAFGQIRPPIARMSRDHITKVGMFDLSSAIRSQPPSAT